MVVVEYSICVWFLGNKTFVYSSKIPFLRLHARADDVSYSHWNLSVSKYQFIFFKCNAWWFFILRTFTSRNQLRNRRVGRNDFRTLFFFLYCVHLFVRSSCMRDNDINGTANSANYYNLYTIICSCTWRIEVGQQKYSVAEFCKSGADVTALGVAR